jgi:hypothetical protein
VVDIPAPDGAQTPRAVKVGVLIGVEPDRIGEWLADAAAFDAGGVDALWIDSGPEAELDVLAVTAALAVVTFRALLVVTLPGSGAASAGVTRTLDTIGRLSRGRLGVVAETGRCAELAGAVPGLTVLRPVPDEPDCFEDLSPVAVGERWVSMPVLPHGRVPWRAARTDAAERGAHGLVVPADPRLLDILRNPDDPGERHDLQLAQG